MTKSICPSQSLRPCRSTGMVFVSGESPRSQSSASFRTFMSPPGGGPSRSPPPSSRTTRCRAPSGAGRAPGASPRREPVRRAARSRIRKGPQGVLQPVGHGSVPSATPTAVSSDARSTSAYSAPSSFIHTSPRIGLSFRCLLSSPRRWPGPRLTPENPHGPIRLSGHHPPRRITPGSTLSRPPSLSPAVAS